jgi:hypothetical protein
MSVHWGDVPGWLSSIATLAAFVAVAIPLWQANDDRRRAQASNVDYLTFAYDSNDIDRIGPPTRPDLAAKATSWDDVWIAVLNHSSNAIYEVLLDLPFWGSELKRVYLGKVPSGDHFVRLVDVTDGPPPGTADGTAMPLTGLAAFVGAITFRDQANRVWVRVADGRLDKLSNRRSEQEDLERRSIQSPMAT